ncbi:type II toxin-antitoxin system prevent-host-death family antitoxin [Pseudarthrobacter sp. N5]|uniref:type II toxin-antitoxin system Phd/YefM family antitoxin n=1 Tax=Pseudarthrobacter sp. N5 TaxID=3418416 RepID=UPI003CED5314
MRELRQHASSVLEQVLRTGESITITNHGKPHAVLHPITADFSWHDQLVADGRLVPATANWRDIAPMALPDGSPTPAELLEQSRTPVIYADTSALFKLMVLEPESGALREYLEAAGADTL